MMTLLIALTLVQDPFEKADVETLKKLETAKLSMKLVDSTIEDAVGMIRDFSKIPVYIDPVGVPNAKELTVTLEASKTAIGSVLRDALVVHDLDWVVIDGMVIVTSKQGREALEKGVDTAALKKDKELWAKIRGKARVEGDVTVSAALAKLGELCGLAMKTDSLKKELLDEKVAESPELSVLGCLRLLAWQKGLSGEIKGSGVTLKKK